MASDLFHDVARAYYGIGPEVYAAGCAAKASKYAAIPSTPGQQGLFSDVDVSPEATQTIGGKEKVLPGLEGILQRGDIRPAAGEIWPEHVNHDQAWMSLDRKRPDKADAAAYRQWWDRNKRLNTYRKMMFHVMHPEHNPLEELDLENTTGDGIVYSLGDSTSYTLANIATHGNAPAGYAMGCEAGEQDQYAVKPMKGQPSLFNKMTESAPPPIAREPSTAQTATAAPAINRKSLQKYNPLAGDLFRAAELLSKKGLHKDAAQAHSGLARYFGALAKNTDDLEAARFAKYHSDQADFHAGQPAPSGTKGYVKPTFAQPETIPDSPGQKHMFTAQDNPDDEEADEEKPDFTETGTGDHVTADESDYSLPSDDISAPKAEEMLANPPHGKPLTGKQKRMLHAAANK